MLTFSIDIELETPLFRINRKESLSFLLQRSSSSSSSRKRDVYRAFQRRRRKKKKKKRNSPLSLYGLKVARGGARRGRPSPSTSTARLLAGRHEEVRSDNNEFRCRPFRPSRRARVVNSTSLPTSSFPSSLSPFFTFRATFFCAARSRQIFICPASRDRLDPYREKDPGNTF